MDEIRTGDLISTAGGNFFGKFSRITTGSITNHIGIAVWISSTDKFGYASVPSKIYPSKHEDAKLAIYEVGFGDPNNPRLKLKLGSIDKVILYNFASYYQHILHDLEDFDLCDKMMKFIKKTISVRVHLGTLRAVNILFNLGTIDNSRTDEYCVSIALMWLEELGYDYTDPITPRRSRMLYTADHLDKKFNRHPLLQSPRVALSVDQSKFYTEPEYFLLLLFITIIIGLLTLLVFYNKKSYV